MTAQTKAQIKAEIAASSANGLLGGTILDNIVDSYNGRILLTDYQAFFADPVSGLDTNDGISAPFKTIQGAYDTIAEQYDFGGNRVDLILAPGTYGIGSSGFAVLFMGTAWVGGGSFNIVGSGGSPSDCLLDATLGSFCLYENEPLPGALILFNVKMTSSGNCITMASVGAPLVLESVEFGLAGFAHMQASFQCAIVTSNTSYIISGGAQYHAFADGGLFDIELTTITLTGTPAFSQAFVYGNSSEQLWYGNTFVGSATGTKFLIENTGMAIVTQSGGFTPADVNALPGNVAGRLTGNATYNHIRASDLPVAVSDLPTPSTALIGTRAFVIDNNTAVTFNAIVTTGGSSKVPVFCDGTNWRIG